MLTMSALRSSTAGLRTVSGRRVLALRPARLGASAAPASAARPSGRRAVSGAVVVRASAAEEPETAKEAIELGNSLAKAAKWQEALSVYEKALTLPGTGLKRYRGRGGGRRVWTTSPA
ncbi:hypothetical protein CHLRE_12g553678v5 [Chlamydomonas reinhardtii]|uniref:Uncharacterized protein n=1 Tax=Chlamydomonas reinhardtii TaxID=3055 RepID=A0A2K3D738_CHLRE|nr:uncharacterized protein CHLRE_12g553678v5 [Chlamydomonas reinhardtii]PNW76349.1 hypothetical protein CHLRE_12g553678v5 [Chlamydomonas reinhardtii]